MPYFGNYVPYCMGAQFLERLLSQCSILVTTVEGIGGGKKKKKAFTCDIHSYTRTHSEQRPAVITSFLCCGNEHFLANGRQYLPPRTRGQKPCRWNVYESTVQAAHHNRERGVTKYNITNRKCATRIKKTYGKKIWGPITRQAAGHEKLNTLTEEQQSGRRRVCVCV